MKILETKRENEKIVMVVEVGPKHFEKAYKKEVDQAIKNVKVPGFRSGKAPLEKATSSLNHRKVLNNTLQKLADLAAEWIDDDGSEATKNILGMPLEIKIEQFDDATKTTVVHLSYESVPTVKLADYSKIVTHHQVSDSVPATVVDERIREVLERQAMLVSQPDAVATKENVVVFDFSGSLNGENLPQATAKNYELDLKNSNFIAGYAEELVGLKAGDNKSFEIKFPDDYQAADLKGQVVTFNVTVHDVKAKVVPELNDEFVTGLGLKEVTTVDAYKNWIANDLENERLNQVVQRNKNAVMEWALANNQTSHMPMKSIQSEAKNEMDQAKAMIDKQFKAMGGFAGYLKAVNQKEDDIFHNILLKSFNGLKLSVVLSAVAEKENIHASDEEVEIFRAQALKNEDLKWAVEKIQNTNQFKTAVTNQKVFAFLEARVVYEPKPEVKAEAISTPQAVESEETQANADSAERKE